MIVNILTKVLSLTARTATFTLTLTINDTNDHTPECSPLFYSASVSEDVTGGGPAIVELTCTDGDAEFPNNDMSYSEVSGTGERF